MSALANPLAIRVSRQKGLFWSDNHPFFQKQSNYRDFLHLSRYLDFFFIHFQRYLRTVYSQPPFIAVGRNYNVAGFGDDRSLIIDFHYYDLFGTLTAVPGRVGRRYADGLTSIKHGRWRFLANPRLAKRLSFYKLFNLFVLGSLFKKKAYRKKRTFGRSRKVYIQFLKKLFNPVQNKRVHMLSSHLSYRPLAHFALLAHTSSTHVADVAITRFKRVAAEARIKMMLLHLLRRTKIVQKKSSKTFLARGWRNLFKRKKDRIKQFRNEFYTNKSFDRNRLFVERRETSHFRARFRHLRSIHVHLARLKENLLYRWSRSGLRTRRDLKIYSHFLRNFNTKVYYKRFNEILARTPASTRLTLAPWFQVRRQSTKAILLEEDWGMEFLKIWGLATIPISKKKEKKRKKKNIYNILDPYEGFNARWNFMYDRMSYIREGFHYGFMGPIFVIKRQGRKVIKSMRRERLSAIGKMIGRRRARVVRFIRGRRWSRRFKKNLKTLLKISRYVKTKQRVVSKILSLRNRIKKASYLYFSNRPIFQKDRNYSWLRKRTWFVPKTLRKKHIWVSKKFKTLRFRKFSSQWVPRFRLFKLYNVSIPRREFRLKRTTLRENMRHTAKYITWLQDNLFNERVENFYKRLAFKCVSRRFAYRSHPRSRCLSSIRLWKNKVKGVGFRLHRWKHLRKPYPVVELHRNFQKRIDNATYFFRPRRWRDRRRFQLLHRRVKHRRWIKWYMTERKKYEPERGWLTLYERAQETKKKLARVKRSRKVRSLDEGRYDRPIRRASKSSRWKLKRIYNRLNKPLRRKQQIIWHFLRFGTNLSVSHMNPFMFRSIVRRKKKSKKRRKVRKPVIGVNVSVLTLPLEFNKYGFDKKRVNLIKSLRSFRALATPTRTVYTHPIRNLTKRVLFLWDRSRIINRTSLTFIKRCVIGRRRHSYPHSSVVFPRQKKIDQTTYFLPITYPNKHFPGFGLRHSRQFKKYFINRRSWDHANERVIFKSPFYSIDGSLLKIMNNDSERKQLTPVRLHLEQLSRVSNLQRYKNFKFRFYRKRWLKRSWKEKKRPKRLSRKARRRHVAKPMPFGSIRKNWSQNRLRRFIHEQVDEYREDWDYGPGRHFHIYMVRKWFKIHFFILTLMYIDGLAGQIIFRGIREPRFWSWNKRYVAIRRRLYRRFGRRGAMKSGVIYELFFRLIMVKNRLMGYITSYYFKYVVMLFFEKMLTKFLTIYNFKSICVRLRPSEDFLSASFIAKFIIAELRKDFSVKYVLKQMRRGLRIIGKQGRIRGYRVLLSGRFARTQMATYILESRGQVALGAISATVDYSMYQFVARYGMCAVKVWLDYPTNKEEWNTEDLENESINMREESLADDI